MTHHFRIGPVFLLLTALAGCALPAAPPSQEKSSRSLARLEQQQQELSKQLATLQATVNDLQQQVSRQNVQINQMGRAPVAEKDTWPSQNTGIRPYSSPAPPPSPPAQPASSATEIYLRAFSDYASGRYPQAIAGFEEFLRGYPDNEYAANAQFWIGECYYSQQDYPRAAAEFMQMAKQYPQSGRTPDALFKAAQSYQKLGRGDQAGQIVNLLRQRYPHSAAAKKNLEL